MLDILKKKEGLKNSKNLEYLTSFDAESHIVIVGEEVEEAGQATGEGLWMVQAGLAAVTQVVVGQVRVGG